jgi:hypothetical protein
VSETTRREWEYWDVTIWEGGLDTWVDSAGEQGTLSPTAVVSAASGPFRHPLFARLLDRYGQQGWELVGMTRERTEHRFFFKRTKS